MQNYKVDVFFFYPCLLSVLELIIRDSKLTVSGEFFEFTCTNHSGKCLVETFHEKQKISLFCFVQLAVVFVISPYNCYHYNKKTFPDIRSSRTPLSKTCYLCYRLSIKKLVRYLPVVFFLT